MNGLNNQEKSVFFNAMMNYSYTNKISSNKCPYCRSYLRINSFDVVWCSIFGCTYSNSDDIKVFLRSLYIDTDYTQLRLWKE